LAPAAPQPWQVWFTCRVFSPQVSPPAPHEPAVVRQPWAALHVAWQHSLDAPTPQVVDDAVQEHGLQVLSEPLQNRVQLAG
jgi:hypothetical protein